MYYFQVFRFEKPFILFFFFFLFVCIVLLFDVRINLNVDHYQTEK